MNSKTRGKLILSILLISCLANAQETLKLSRTESEAIFLKENLSLLAEELQISQAETKVIQAKLWPNPTFTLDQVNFWATDAQTGGQEVIPPLGNILGTNRQAGLELEQLVQTARKRKKLIAVEQVSVEKSKQYFEDLLRSLKIEFRNKLTELQYLQLSKSVYQNQFNSVQKLAKAYKNQVDQGNFPKGEYIRIKALELEISKELTDVIASTNESQKELKMLMRLDPTLNLEILDDNYWNQIVTPNQFLAENLIEKAKENRPDYKLAQLEKTYSEKLLIYEKSQKTPDVNFSVAYDRGGNAMWDFIGFGLSFDLPVFNRNQGNIASAKIGQEIAETQFQQKDLALENEIVLANQNLNQAILFHNDIERDYEKDLDTLWANYTKNFLERKISLLEYLDFTDAYLVNKKIIIEAKKEVHDKSEELNYTVGIDLIQ
ncbi:TolC family protein [Formosa sp. 4Alg 33]|uniref:TolC family protein n=1 Tax=Formosa sp. 4Alg 33 TaxID=3382189 RepID=UPI003D9C30A6